MKRLSKNLLSLLSADITRRLLGFASVAYLARILGKEDFGAINLAFAVLAYAMVLGSAGFSILGTKRIAQGDSQELIGSIIGGRLITTILVLFLLSILTLLTVRDIDLAKLIILFSCAILPQIFFLDWYFQGKEKMGIVSAARVLQAVVYLVVVLAFVRSSRDIIWVALGAILGECSASILLYLSFRSIYHNVSISVKPSLDLLRRSVPLAVGIIISTLVMNYPTIALGIFSTKSDIGAYSAASKLVYSLLMGDRILILLLIPASSRKFAQEPGMLGGMLQEAIKWILILGLPVAVGGSLVAENLIVLVFGPQYAGSAAILRILIWYFLLTMLHTTFTSGLIAAGNEKAYGKIMLITACAYLVLVSIGAYWFGPIGAALSVVIAEGFSMLMMNHSLKSVIEIHPPKKLLHIIISVILMALCSAFFLEYGLIWVLCAGIGSYFFFLIIVRAINRNDIKTLMARF